MAQTGTLAVNRRWILAGTGGLVVSACAPTGAGLFDEAEIAALRTIGEGFAPGAASAGYAEFIEAMVASPDPINCYKLMGFPMAPRDFYKGAVASLRALVRRRHGVDLDKLSTEKTTALLNGLLAAEIDAWNGPPAELVHIVLRNDAIDVVYGSEAAYDRLETPYLAHIAPPPIL